MLAAMTEFKRELVSRCGLMWVSVVCVRRWEELAKLFLPIRFIRLVCDCGKIGLTLDSLSPGLVRDRQ